MQEVKSRRVFVRVTEEQHAMMRAKADAYGITLSRLVLMSVEAYTRAYGEWPDDGSLVVVNYGVWSMVDDKLQGIEHALRITGRQLGGVRRALLNGNAEGQVLDALDSCRSDLRCMMDGVVRCTRVLDHVCDTTHLVDPYLGPMEGDVAATSTAHGD